MYLKNIEIQNFKGIRKKSLDFDSTFTVLIGDNGSGKTSVLDAISIGIGTLLQGTGASFGINSNKARPLLQKEIRKENITSESIEYSHVWLKGQLIHNDKEYTLDRDQSLTAKSLSYSRSSNLKKLGKYWAENIKEPIDLPLFAYHSTARLAGNIYAKKSYGKIGSRFDGYYACLDPRSIRQKFISWFKTFEDRALKFNEDKTLYYAFTKAITTVVPDWHDIKFHWGLDDLLGQTNDGKWLPLADLSDGYRSMVRLAADIAYRAIKLNSHLGEDAVALTKGIVLIDEIDMHLHPTWQKRIVADLKRAFPNIQFIATTHSPFIVQSLAHNELINLDGREMAENPSERNLIDNALYMGVESEKSIEFDNKEKLAAEYIIELSKAIENKQNLSSNLSVKLDELDELIANTTDPLFKAKLELEKISKLGSS